MNIGDTQRLWQVEPIAVDTMPPPVEATAPPLTAVCATSRDRSR